MLASLALEMDLKEVWARSTKSFISPRTKRGGAASVLSRPARGAA